MSPGRIGIQIGASTKPSELGSVAAEAERLGYHEIWLAEDYFDLGGFSSSAIALAATERIPVGLGVVAAAVRHPAVTAMEAATLAEGHGNRFMAGLGHGSPGWVRQMGLEPDSPMGLLRAATRAVRQLLDGEVVSEAGAYFGFDQVHLGHPPSRPVPIYLGVHGPASLRLSGELADGTLLGWFSSPGYVRWARQRIEEGRARSGSGPHQLVVLCLLSVSDEDPHAARRELAHWSAPIVKALVGSPQLEPGVTGIEQALLGGPEIEQRLSTFAAVGTTEECRSTIDDLFAAGADRVVLVPNPGGRLSSAQMIDQMGQASVLA